MSQLKSAGLFFQETWANVSKYISGTAAYAGNKQAQTISQEQKRDISDAGKPSKNANETTQLLSQQEKRASYLEQKTSEPSSRVSTSNVASSSSLPVKSVSVPQATSAVPEKTERTSVRVSAIATPGHTPSAFRESLTVNVAIGREDSQAPVAEQCLSHLESYQVETKDGQPAQLYELKEKTLTVEVTSELLSVKAVNPKEDDCKKVATLLKEVSPQGPKEVEVKSKHQQQKDNMETALKAEGHTVVTTLESRAQKGFESAREVKAR